ncbi:MAG: GNAT family N-acetyltransferase [Pseudomonadota bacterium]
MRIEVDDLKRPSVRALLAEHMINMHELTPAESVHALDIDELRAPDVTFWTAWSDEELLGCGALKELSRHHGEIKSMRTPASKRRRGAGRVILTHIIQEASFRGYERLSLETGPAETFGAAHRLYEDYGFQICGPFGAYTEDPYSVFMTMVLANASKARV